MPASRETTLDSEELPFLRLLNTCVHAHTVADTVLPLVLL